RVGGSDARRRRDRGAARGRPRAGRGRARRHPHRTDRARTNGGRYMKPAATYPQRRDDVRLLVIDPAAPVGAALHETRTPALPDFLAAGDLLIVNDAATVPASLRGHDDDGNEIEARLLAARGDDRFSAVLFGAGDWRQRTEDRPPPAALPVGARLRFGALVAEIAARAPASPRLVDLRFSVAGDELWAGL